MPVNGGIPKSVRKPLRVLSNNGNRNGGGKISKSAIMKKKIPEKQKENDESLDRLLLVQSDLSSVLRQIDKLVVQAFELKTTSKESSKEIDSFANFLSEMLSSLKPWVPRFKKAISGPTESKNQLSKGLASESVSIAKEDDCLDVASPVNTKLDFLVSPSPLVSWRAECNVDKGRQLFLLTPLPMSKTLSSKHQDPKPSASRLAEMAEEGNTVKCEIVSSPKPSKGDHSMLIMTPCLKMSPPKSCVLLEPIHEPSHGDCRVRKSTPFHVGLKNSSSLSESPDSETSSDGLNFKYPELLGIKQRYNKSETLKKELDDSPTWLFSPPKSCVLLEPPDEKCHIPSAADQKTNLPSSKADNVKDAFPKSTILDQGKTGKRLLPVESTPLWKEPESILHTGKRPGETTLKKELWTRFEAASTYGLRHTASPSPMMRTAQKGFLDMLDEVSHGEGSPTSEVSR